MPTMRYRAAVHEAGHACVAMLLGIPVASVMVSRVDLARSHTTMLLDHWERRCKPGDAATIALSGAAAERVLLGLDAEPSPGDMEIVAAALKGVYRVNVFPAAADAVYAGRLKRARRRAASLVRQHRLTIAAVAGRLMARGRLSAADVSALVGVPAQGRPWPGAPGAPAPRPAGNA